ncbi:MAG: hypothetical protein QXJ75_05105 [Candidatus Bathyarchaeia archaeon]
MTVLKQESEEVASNFRGVCPLCDTKVNFAVEKLGRFDTPKFSCSNCGAAWEYWEDWENPPKMKGARLVKVDKDLKGVKLRGIYLESSFWQKVIEDKTNLEKFESKTRRIPEAQLEQAEPKQSPTAELSSESPKPEEKGRKWGFGGLGFKRLKSSGKANAAVRLKGPGTYSGYGLKLGYQQGWVVMKDLRCKDKLGRLELRGPSNFKINIDWGPLADMKEKAPTPSKYIDTALMSLGANKIVVSLDVKAKRTIMVRQHEGVFVHCVVDISRYGLLQKITERLDLRYAIIYCEESQRYFVIRGQTPPETSMEYGEAFENLIRSFDCHPQT